MSRVAGTIAKFVIVIVVIASATILFRKDTRRALSEHWEMQKCPGRVEADIGMIAPWAEPKVGRCEGPLASATCDVETRERSGRKTAPVKHWDCTKRHIRADAYVDFIKAGISAVPPPGEKDSEKRRELVDKAMRVKDDLLDSIKYVRVRWDERRELLGEPPEDPRDILSGHHVLGAP